MLIKNLTEASGVSGNEKEIREIIIEEIKPYVDNFKIDRLGNILAIKKGLPDYPEIMISAHMDEVGLIVKSIDSSGLVKFTTVGGIDTRILVSKAVKIGKDKVKGVIGAKAIHLQEPNERNEILKTKQLYIDIGAQSKEDAEKYVKIGDYITFDSKYVEFGNNLIKAKALDDRAGCALLIELLKENFNCTILAAFTVQEELGLRGATVASYSFSPNLALILESTTCYDVTDIEEPQLSTRIGKGPALSIMDRTSYFDKNLRDRIIDIAKKNNINYQFKHGVTGGNDAGAIHLAKEGIRTIGLSVPCRYIHSPINVISKDDYDETYKLAKTFLKNINKEAK